MTKRPQMIRKMTHTALALVTITTFGACLQAKSATPPATTGLADAAGTQADATVADDASTSILGPTDVQTPVQVVQTGSWQTDPATAPRAIHLTWQHDSATTLTVQWSTGATVLEGYTPYVWFDTAEHAGADGAGMAFGPSHVVPGSGELYYQTLFAVGDETPRYVTWTAEITGLSPDTAYTMRVGTWGSFTQNHFDAPNLSELVTTHTAPLKGSQKKLTMVLAGDSRGGSAKIAEHAERFAKLDADLWLFNGDFNDQGTQQQWDDWFAAMQPILARHPLLAVQGNHEFFPPMYYGQFALPVMPGLPDGYQEHAWSLNYGNVHVVGLDSTQDSTVEDQTPWLEADLQAASQDPDIQWIVVGMHHPAYSACTNHGSTDRVQKNWVPVFEKYNVDLVFAGHDHDYERTWPIRQNQKAAQGPVYVVAGGFFADGYTNGNDWWTATSTHGKTSNYVVMTVTGKELSLTAYSGDGANVLDSYAVQK